jgi:hypothetical protein
LSLSEQENAFPGFFSREGIFSVDSIRYSVYDPGMETQTIAQLRGRIRKIQEEIGSLGQMRPGSISKQYNVCGNPTCRCKDPKHPQRHGPYYKLSYTWLGRGSTEFVREEDLAETQQQLDSFKRFKALMQEWVGISIELAHRRREARRREEKKR